jgi:hypothetical protein
VGVQPDNASQRLRAAARRVGTWTRRLIVRSGFLLFGIGVFLIVRLAVEGLPLSGQVVVLALVYVPLGWLVYALSKMPDETLAPVRRHGLAQPFFFVTGLWLAAIGWVSSLAFLLHERGVIAFRVPGDGGASVDTGRLADFFVWHSFEQIPALGVNDTLQWEMPLDYGGGAGFLVLAFKLLILLPLVPVFLAAWRHRRSPERAPASGG